MFDTKDISSLRFIEKIKILYERSDDPHNIYTPIELCQEIVNKIPSLDGKILVIANLEFVYTLYREGVPAQNIYFATPCPLKFDAARSLLDKNNVFKYNNVITTEDVNNMKFDVVIGNPPYQEATTDVQGSRGNLWHKFVFASVNTLVKKNGYVAMITPNSWLQLRGKIGETFKQHQIGFVMTKIAHHFPGIGSTFTAWLLQKRKPKYPADFVDENIQLNIHKLNSLPNKNLSGVTILEKVHNSPHPRFSFISDTQNNVSWKNNPEYSYRYGESRTEQRKYRICHTQRADFFAINKPLDYDVPKVIMPLMTGTPQPRYVETGIGSVSRMSIHMCVRSKQEGERIVSLLKSKVYQYVIRVQNNRNSMTKDWINQLPKLDLTRSWTDEELYEHFNLTKEEIELIEETIK